jgi:hypothetical protein
MLIWGLLLVASWAIQASMANRMIDHLLFFAINLTFTSLWIFVWLMLSRSKSKN